MPERLPGEVRAMIENLETELIFSAASLWEIAIKSGLGGAISGPIRVFCVGDCWRMTIRNWP